MNWLMLGLFGAAGALARDAFELRDLAKTRQGGAPKEWRSFVFVFGSFVRVLAGGLLAGALAAIDQISGPLGAFLVGSLGPVLLSRLVEYLAPEGVYQ